MPEIRHLRGQTKEQHELRVLLSHGKLDPKGEVSLGKSEEARRAALKEHRPPDGAISRRRDQEYSTSDSTASAEEDVVAASAVRLDRYRQQKRISRRSIVEDPPAVVPQSSGGVQAEKRPVRQRRSAVATLPPGMYSGNEGAELVAAQEESGGVERQVGDRVSSPVKPKAKKVRTPKRSLPGRTKAEKPKSDSRVVETETATRSGHFLQIDLETARRTDLSAPAKLVLMYLQNTKRMSKSNKKPVVQPKQDTIANALGMSRKTVGRCCKELEDAGLITRRRRGNGFPTVYTVR